MNSLNLMILLLTVYKANAYISSGNCIAPPIIPDFSPSGVSLNKNQDFFKTCLIKIFLIQYSGDWYEMTRLPALNELNLKCVRLQYRILNSTTLAVHNGGINSIYNQSEITEGNIN